jgi:catechol 2,3-dioxygenase-like lactoylglutathione lyase family enzyme
MTTLPLRHVALTARADQFEAVSDFYQGVFGWSKTRDMSAPHGRVHLLADGHGGEIELLSREVIVRPERTPQPPGHICFSVPAGDFDAIVAAVRAAGIEVGEPRVSTRQTRRELDESGKVRTDGGRHRYVFFYDPAENCVELSESP